jgi:hypothetical protein
LRGRQGIFGSTAFSSDGDLYFQTLEHTNVLKQFVKAPDDPSGE